MTDKSLLSLTNGIAIETELMAAHGATPVAQKLTNAREGILADLNTIGKSGSLESIVAAEKILVEKDLADHTNSPKMASSLKEAQNGLETIEEHIGIVGNPAEYQTVNKSNSLKKMRDSRDLPKDGARQAFRSHDTRLENLDAGRVSDTEKDIIQQRQKNIRTAEKEYINRQYKALGIEPPKPEPRRVTRTGLDEVAKQLRTQAIEEGKNPAVVDAALKAIMQSGSTRAVSPKTPKAASRSKEEPGIER